MASRQFVIQFGGLSVGTHEYEFEINDQFFEDFESTEVEHVKAKVNLSLVKQNSLLTLNFNIKGTFGVACDRCLANFDIPFETRQALVVKNGNVEESNDEILVLPHGAAEVNLAQPLYEFISLAIPPRKVPCELDSKKYVCDVETLNRLNNIAVEQDPEEPVNPIWDKLKNVNFNNN